MSSPLWLSLILLAFAPSSTLGRPSESPQQQQSTSTQSLVKTLGQEIGSPSELAWQAWLLVESKGGMASALDSSNILRRITPKSIFIAPELISCPSGYSTDGRGTCRPDPIVLDEVAQKQFLLKRLNALYGKIGANKNKKPDPVPQGPLQINIPIGQSAKPSTEQTIPVLVSQQPVVVDNKTQEAVAVVVYKVDNDTKKDNNTSFLLGSSNASVPSKQVAEIIVEASNDTFTEVVDYKIPVVNSTTSKKDSSEDSSPTVVLLLSPTKVPSTTTTTTEETTTSETTTMPTTIVDETKFEPIQTVVPLDVDTTIVDTTTERVTMTSRDEYERRDQQMTTMTSAPSTTLDDETAYTEEDDETQTPEQDSTEEEEEYEDEFTEDELLKPGEAGSMMSAKNQELIRSKTHHHRTTIPVTMTTSMVQDTTTPIPTTDDALEAKESTIKAEFTTILQTTTTTEVPSTIVVEETTTPRVTATIQIDTKPIPQRYLETRRPAPTTDRSTFIPQRRPSFSVNDEAPIFFKDRLPPEFKDQLPPRTYIRFPDTPTRQQNRGGYVRFPSDDVNSIHHDSLKDLSPFQYSSSTKSSVQRWRQQQQQKQKPMLLRFWARMPLVRDLSFYPTTSHGSHNEPIGGPTPPTVRRAIFKSDG